MTSQFLPPPALPSWLEEEMPFNRRVFSDGDHEIHFIDEGSGPPILLLHGNPTWSFLWRKVIGWFLGSVWMGKIGPSTAPVV